MKNHESFHGRRALAVTARCALLSNGTRNVLKCLDFHKKYDGLVGRMREIYFYQNIIFFTEMK